MESKRLHYLFYCFIFITMWVTSIDLTAQSVTVKGTIKDSNSVPIIGATIVVKGSESLGTVSDYEGNYTLSNIPENSILTVSYVGMTTQTVPLNGRSSIDIIMSDDTELLEELVVMGYGTLRKKDLTGSVLSIGNDKLIERSYTNALQSLSGQAAGVQITQSQGAPGFAPSIKIRGSSSINAGTTPLYVIDGIPMEDATKSSGTDGASNLQFNGNPLNNINPYDIESIDILKDASSAAIYGSRGANGVVIITTKQGKSGKTQVNLNYEYGLSKVTRPIEMMDAKEWMEFETAARTNSWNTILKNNPNAVRGNNTKIPVEFSDPAWLERIGNGTDWQDVLFRNGQTHNVQLSVAGGNEKTTFMISAGYNNVEGVVDQNKYNRITLRSNLRHTLSERIDVGANLSLVRMNASDFGIAGKSDAVSLTVQNDPIFPLYVETGSLGFKDPSSIWNTFVKYGFQLWHPYSLTREMTKNKLTNNSQSVVFANINILDGLSFKTSLSADITDVHYADYWNEGQNWGYSGWVKATGTARTYQVFNWVLENTLNFNKYIGDHYLTGVVGHTVQEQRIDNSSMTAGSFPNDLVHTLNAGKVTSGFTDAAEWALISYLARATYSYKDKYLSTLAIRADGCSRFGVNNRWGYFPSASVGWRMSEEEFLKDKEWLDNLKLRISYGLTGNNQIPNYGAIGLLGYAPYISGSKYSTGIYTNTFPDKELKWEKTGQVNLGFDARLFNRLDLSFDYYYSRTNDLLLDVPIPVLTGFTETLTNIGELQNKGMEFNLNSKNIVGTFNWSTNLNIFGNRNKILKLANNDAPFNKSFNDALVRFEVGQPMANYYGYVFDGVILSEADMKTYPVWPGSEPGDPKVVDVSGPNGVPDGVIDGNDRTVIGNHEPLFSWGITNSFEWKGIDLSLLVTGSYGGEIMNQHARFLKSFNGDRNAYKLVNNFWKSEADPGNGKINKPRVIQNTVQHLSSTYWVEDGSFVRIKNLRIGYNLPKSIAEKLFIQSAKIYINCENLYVFSDYSNYDPEGSTYQTGAFVGLDYGAYPNPTVWTIGANINF